MKDKQEILAELQEGLQTGVISEDELKSLVTSDRQPAAMPTSAQITAPSVIPATPQAETSPNKPEKLSAVDIIFYVAGIVLFAAIISVIFQTWNDGYTPMHITLTAGTGVGLWALAYYLIKSPFQNDIRKGLINSTLLTGSLSIITGGYIITNKLTGSFDTGNLIPGAIMLACLGAIHLAFDRLIRKDLTILMGILLSVAAFPALLFGLLKDFDIPVDIWSLILIVSAGLLAFAARVATFNDPARKNIRNAFDSFAVNLSLLAMYIASYRNFGALWLLLLIMSIFGIFYLSIITQSKQLLGNASLFLVLTVITISFKYFSGFGVTSSLILSAIGLLGTAAIATTINRKYFKQAPQNTQTVVSRQP